MRNREAASLKSRLIATLKVDIAPPCEKADASSGRLEDLEEEAQRARRARCTWPELMASTSRSMTMAAFAEYERVWLMQTRE